jgi:DNA-binding CsgD family transcriptional regulator
MEAAGVAARTHWQRIAAEASEHDFEPVPLRAVWARVLAGEIVFRDAFLSPAHALLVTRSPESPLRCHRANVVFLQHALDCASLTTAAIDYRMSASGASTRAKWALESLGLTITAAKIPLPLSLLLHTGGCSIGHHMLKVRDHADPDTEILFTERPDIALRKTLPPREAETLRLYIDGLSHAQIADLRGASTRTIANQLASVFRKLQVSGRFELMRALVCGNPTQEASTRPAAHDLAVVDHFRCA